MTKQSIIITILTIIFTACVPVATSSSPPTSHITTSPSKTVTNTPMVTVREKSLPTPIFTPTTAYLASERTSPIDGMPQVFVPAGILRMGGLDIHADDRDELPAHDVSLDAFWIDMLEVTNAMYMLCVQAESCTVPEDWASDRRLAYFNEEKYKDYPVVHVTWEQANTYCAWAERRLPSEAEWERAARGDDFSNFPWGDEPPNEHYANFNRLVNDTSRVGSYAAGVSHFGAFDMAGNVWEWVADLYKIEYYSISPKQNPSGPETNISKLRVLRGGSFQDEWIDLRVSKRGAALGPNPNAPHDAPNRAGEHLSKIGFRCAADE